LIGGSLIMKDFERFERGEHKQHSYLFHPFGGGAHKCIGMNFAQMVFRIFMFNIIKRHEIQLRPGYDADLQYLPIPEPKDDLPMRLIPIN
jgi:cytochrome P450